MNSFGVTSASRTDPTPVLNDVATPDLLPRKNLSRRPARQGAQRSSEVRLVAVSGQLHNLADPDSLAEQLERSSGSGHAGNLSAIEPGDFKDLPAQGPAALLSSPRKREGHCWFR